MVSMWDAYCSFQTEVVGQDALELGLRHQLSFAEPPPLPPQKGTGFRRLLAYCFVSGLGLQDQHRIKEF